MANSYRSVDRDQEFLLPPDMREWLPQNHLVWFLIAAVERMDTSAFHSQAKLGGVGRRGYDPVMLLTLFIYAMAQGESSSRRIERLCHTDVAFRVICAQDVPDHSVLARFRQKHQEALTSMLTESLVLAAELGMVQLGVVALDGTKIAANASSRANRTETTLRRLAEEYVGTVAATDAEEDALFGADSSGDELPEQLKDRSDRRGRIDRALDQIQARRDQQAQQAQEEAARARDYEARVAAGTAKGGAPRGVDKVQMARIRWERDWANADARYRWYQTELAAGRRPPGRPPVAADQHKRVHRAWQAYQKALAQAPAWQGPAVQAEDSELGEQSHRSDDEPSGESRDQHSSSPGSAFRANLTDPDSRSVKGRNGWVQGMNCQTSTSSDVFILTAEATQDPNDVGQFIPVKDQLQSTMALVAARTGRKDLNQVGVMLADAGYDSNANLTAEGPDRLIADSTRRHMHNRAAEEPATGPPPEGGTARETMNHRLRTVEGQALYKRRAHMIEAPNAWLKDRRGLRRFSRRGLPAVQAELSFAAAVTNLLRIATTGTTTDQLKTA